jgi:hypothetical protein
MPFNSKLFNIDMIMSKFLPNRDSSEQTIKSPVFAEASSDPNRRFSGNCVPLIVSSIYWSIARLFVEQNRSISKR